MARSSLLAMDKFLGSFCLLFFISGVDRGTFAPLASKGGEDPPSCGARHKVLFCCSPQGEEEEEGREGRGWDRPRVPWGTGLFLLISGVAGYSPAWLLADNYLAGCKGGSRKTCCPPGLENLPILDLIWERQPKRK